MIHLFVYVCVLCVIGLSEVTIRVLRSTAPEY